jgi:hypothetical protein
MAGAEKKEVFARGVTFNNKIRRPFYFPGLGL